MNYRNRQQVVRKCYKLQARSNYYLYLMPCTLYQGFVQKRKKAESRK